MALKTIKNVDEETWHHFKRLAVTQRSGMGTLLKKMINEYESKSRDAWKAIFEGEKILTDVEAGRLLKETATMRKERGFRFR